MRIKTTLLILLTLNHTTQVAHTSPVVVYDNGKTINAQPFYPFKKPNLEDLTQNIPKHIKNMPKHTRKSIQQFPVISSRLSVGKVHSRKMNHNPPRIPRAICVIGDDKHSKRWLKAHRAKLQAINALCVVVNVGSQQRFNAIQALAPKIEFQALKGDIFASALNIKHYPFLFNKGFISQ